MQVRYFYDNQTERVIKHLVRVFNEFQVVSHNVNGVDVYKKVPCRYYDYSRQALYMLNKGSENMLQSAPFITISLDDLQLDRQNVRSPTSQNIVVGINAQDSTGNYTDQLADQRHVTRFNPVPWTLSFSVNIWTTLQKNKFELFEQIVRVCNPSIVIQLSENPLDWTSQITIELIGTDISNKSYPSGESTREDLELTILKFKTTIWYSLPAIDTKANLINAIQAKIASIDPDDYNDYMLDLNNTDLSTDIYTPNNYRVKTAMVTGGTTATYDVTLLTRFGLPHDDDGNILLWEKYFQFYDIDYQSKQISLRFSTELEDGSPIIGIVQSINKNVVRISIDMSARTKQTIYGFIETSDQISSVPDNNNFIALFDGEYESQPVVGNTIYTKNGTTLTAVDISTSDLVYNADDTLCYIYSDDLGWHGAIYNVYKSGLWKIGFKQI